MATVGRRTSTACAVIATCISAIDADGPSPFDQPQQRRSSTPPLLPASTTEVWSIDQDPTGTTRDGRSTRDSHRSRASDREWGSAAEKPFEPAGEVLGEHFLVR